MISDPYGGSSSLVNPESRADSSQIGWRSVFALLALALPPALFSGLLFRTTLNLPILDDYNAILDFLNHWADCRSSSEKLVWFLSSQLVDMKPFLVHTVALVQYLLLGHVNFRLLAVCSVGLLFVLALLLWKMFIPTCSDRALRIMLFLPIPFLLFQLQYMTELNVVTAGIAHIAGLLFSLMAIYLLNQNTPRSFSLGCIVFVLAIASDANGFMVLPVGLLIFFRSHRYRHLALFLGVAFLCVSVYAFHYHRVLPTGTIANAPGLLLGLLLKLLYVLAFIGSAAGLHSRFLGGALLLGTFLVAFFAWKVVRGRTQRSPLLYDCALFMLLTAVLASSGRSGLGLSQSLSARYTLHSIVWLCLFWAVEVQDSLLRRPSPLGGGAFLGMLLCSVVFSLSSDLMGYWTIQNGNRSLTGAMVHFEHPSAADPNPFPVPQYRFPGQNGVEEGFRLRQAMRSILEKSIELGIYRPSL